MGRRARLELVFRHRRGRTELAHAYAEPPFRVGRGFDVDGALYVIVVCAGPGIFAGDDLHQAVTVERGARVLLASQSALQVHPGRALEPARVQHRYLVEDAGELHCHWDPIIPFADSRLRQRFDLDVAAGGRLYWSDALMSGRCRRGEAWQFRSLEHELRLSIDGSLVYLERYGLGEGRLGHSRPFAVADYLGTSLIHHTAAGAAFAERLHALVGEIDDVRGGVDLVEPGLVVARLLSGRGVPFARARSALHEATLATLFENPKLVVRR